MALNINPIGDRVVAVPEEPKTKTASGIYLPDNAQEKSKIAKVVAAGSTVQGVKVGDRILYKEYSTTEIKVDGDEYIILETKDVLATVN